MIYVAKRLQAGIFFGKGFISEESNLTEFRICRNDPIINLQVPHSRCYTHYHSNTLIASYCRQLRSQWIYTYTSHEPKWSVVHQPKLR
jgi:hypothetical protein